MDFWNILAALGSVSSIIGLIYSVFTSKDTLKRRIISFILLIVMAISVGSAVYLNSELKRVNDIHKKAESVCKDYSINHSEYIHEVLTFLEENKDSYPDAYYRADIIYETLPEPESLGSVDAYKNAAEAMHGIIKGIITINE